MLTTIQKGNPSKWQMTLPMITLMLLMFSVCTAQDNKIRQPGSHKTEYIIDTLTLFDPNTYEEHTIIYKVPAEMKPAADGRFASEWLQNDAKGYTLDTVTIFDPVTLKPKLIKITVVLDEK